jgi:hypothetical protein
MRYSEVAQTSAKDEQPLLVSVAKASTMLDLPAWDVRALCVSGDLRAGKVRNRWRISPESVKEYAERLTSAPTEEQAS